MTEQPIVDYGLEYKWYSHPPMLPDRDSDGFDRVDDAVVVVGAGPIGLTVAAGLSRMGIRTVVLEADETVCRSSKANGISQRTFETLDRVAPGLGDRLGAEAVPIAGSEMFFGRRPILEQVGTSKEQTGGKYHPMSYLSQWFIEDGLVQELERRPHMAELRWQSPVTAVEAHPDHVVLDVSTPLGAYRLRAPWVVAADGGRSSVRSALGLRMTGTDYGVTLIIVDAVISGPQPLAKRRVWFDPEYLPGGMLMHHLPPDGLWRIDIQLPLGTDVPEATNDDNVDRIIRAHLADIGHDADEVRPIWTSTYRPRALCLDDFRHGRILFAGDAAHLMPFFGGFGMNAGIDDADNLRWKLGLVVRGDAPEALLDTYTTERIPAILSSLEIQSRSAEFMTPTSRASEQLRQAALTLAAEGDPLTAGLGRHRVTRPIPYADSPICLPDSEPVAEGPRPGAPVERGWLSIGGQRRYLHDVLDGGLRILAFGDGGGGDAQLDQLADVAKDSGLPVELVWVGPSGTRPESTPRVTVAVDSDGALASRFDARGGGVYLIRPDGIVSARWHRPTAEQLAEALRVTVGELVASGQPEEVSA